MRLVDIEGPLEEVEFPNGTKIIPVPFGPAEYKLWREMPSETENEKRGKMLLQIIHACYPTATVDDLDSCTPKMLIAMAAHAGRKIDQIRDALKNVDMAAVGATPAPVATTPPSSPTRSGNTSASKSRKRSARTSGTSTTASPTVSPT